MLKSCKIIIAGLKLCAFPGSVKNVVTGTITLPQSLFAVEFEDAIFCFFLLSLSFSPAWITLKMAIKKILLLRDYEEIYPAILESTIISGVCFDIKLQHLRQ